MGIFQISRRFAAHAVRGFARKFRYNLSFTASAASTAMLHQDGNMFTVARTTDGVYVLTAKDKFKRIYADAQVLKTADWDVKVLSRVQGGAAANSVTLEVTDAATPDDPEVEVMVGIDLVYGGGD